MSFPAPRVVTAGLRPELFAGTHSTSRLLIVTTLSLLVLVGFGFRLNGLSSEGLSDDELNKLNAVNEYRTQGPTGANGEHPFLMKALLTVSVIVSDRWNQTSLVTGRPGLNIPVETSLRVPGRAISQ